MDINVDIRKFKNLKKNDIIIFNGKLWEKTNTEMLLKPLYDEIEKLKQANKEIRLDVEATFEAKLKEAVEAVIRGYAER